LYLTCNAVTSQRERPRNMVHAPAFNPELRNKPRRQLYCETTPVSREHYGILLYEVLSATEKASIDKESSAVQGLSLPDLYPSPSLHRPPL
jgi:hypothetical protein